MAEKQNNFTGKKLIKTIAILTMIIILIAGSYYAILNGIIEIIKNIVNGVIEVFSHSIITYARIGIAQAGNFISKHMRSGII